MQREARNQEIRDAIHYTTVARILATASLPPHRWRYWKTTVWDAAAIRRAARVLWCYERAPWLRERGIVVLARDEKPNLQALERDGPVRPMIPGHGEQQEFDYVRHGTVNFLAALTVPDGAMWSACRERNDGDHFRPALRRLLGTHARARGVYLVMDNGPSHVAGETLTLLAAHEPWVRVLLTPPHASWLNQAELLLGAFSARYIARGHWDSRERMIEHLAASSEEYNRLWAHPFAWSWTRSRFDQWLAKTTVPNPCITSATRH